MSSPWSSGADSSSIWNSNSPNLNLLRRYSLRTNSVAGASQAGANAINSTTTTTGTIPVSTCTWESSGDGKYLVGYIVISRQDLDIYHATLGFQLSGGKPTHDGQLGAIVEHVVPGSLMNIVCKLKVGDEIVEWNGCNLRNKRNDEVCRDIESVKNTDSLRLVAIRSNNNNNNNSNNTGANSGGNSGTGTVTGTGSGNSNNNNNGNNNNNSSNNPNNSNTANNKGLN